MKHVWILNHYAPHPDSPGGMRHFSLARHLRKHGWSASIIAADSDLSAGTAPDQLNRDGVSFLWVPARPYVGNGMGRVLNMLDYTRAVLRRGALDTLERPDAIIGSSVHPLAAWAGRRLARRLGVPFLFEVRDLWPQTLIDMGRLSQNHPASIALRALEKSLYKSAARIIVLLPRAGDYIAPLGIPADRIRWIPNGVALDLFPPNPPRAATSPFTLMYFGAHGDANGLDNLLEAMGIVQVSSGGEEIILRMIGEGAQKERLMSVAAEMKLENVQFEKSVSKSEIPSLSYHADAFIICVRKLPGLYRFGISMNKIYDYLAASRPVIISVEAANNPIAEAGAGLTVPPEDPQALATAILEMAALSDAQRADMGASGRRYLEAHHSMENLAGRLATVLDESVEDA